MTDFTSEEFNKFKRELLNHPELKSLCEECVSFSEVIATIAAELGVVLDGYYSHADFEGLFKLLRNKLEDRRRPVSDFKPILLS